MSLIDEALKRARREAARQDAARQGALYPSVPRHMPARSRSRLAIALAATAVVVFLLATTGFLFYQFGQRASGRDARGIGADSQTIGPAEPPARRAETEAGGGPTVPTANASAAAGAAASGTPAAVSTETPSEVQGVEGAGADDPGTARVAPGPTAPPQESRAGTTGRPDASVPPPNLRRDEPASPAGSDRAPSAATTAQPQVPKAARQRQLGAHPAEAGDSAVVSEAESYLRAAKLPGGSTVTLSGIAWSGAFPYALINGKVVGIGEKIEGYTISRIEPKVVELHRGDHRLLLTLE